MTVNAATVTIGATPTVITSLPFDGGAVIVQNTGSTAVFLGGDTVSATGQTAGPSLGAGATMTIPGPVSDWTTSQAPQLYGIVASGTGTVAFLAVN